MGIRAVSQGIGFVLESITAHKANRAFETEAQEDASASPTNLEGLKGLDRNIKASKSLLLYEGWG